MCYMKKMKFYHAYILKQNSNPKKQTVPLVIPNGEGKHYLAIKIYLHC